MTTRHPSRSALAPRGQRGASAVEFALLFPLLFGLMYGAVVYSFAYVLRQSITFAAQEAAEAAVDVDPRAADYDDRVTTAAVSTANSVVAWMPSNLRGRVTTVVQFCGDGAGESSACASLEPGADAVVVTINLPLTGASQLFARFTLPFIGNFPPLPATMTAQGVARV